MESRQIAKHLRMILAGSRAIFYPIILDASIYKHSDGSISAPMIFVESSLKADSVRQVSQNTRVTRSDGSYVQRWRRLERET